MDDSKRKTGYVFHSVTTVRGLAALAVCWFHMGFWSEQLPQGWLYDSAQYGWMGPHVFFIVSGFVVPWSLYVVGYRWRDAHRYLARRLVRLDPPYFSTMFVVIGLAYLGFHLGLHPKPPEVDAGRIASHIAYLTTIVGEHWYNPVFWTLAIEFQFYLLIGLLLPWLASPNVMVRRAAMLACLAAYAPFAAGPQFTWVTGYLPLFMLGFTLFQHHAGLIYRREMTVWVVLLSGLVAYTFVWYLAVVSLAAFVYMLLDRFRNGITEFLGRVSYSLYLIHLPVGIPFLRLTEDFMVTDIQRIVTACAAMALCVFAAWFFYLWIERPSVRLARRISLRRDPRRHRLLRYGLAWSPNPDTQA